MLDKLLSGLIVMTVLPPLIVALKAISAPLELFSLRVMSASTFESSRAELLISLTASLKVRVMSEATATAVALFAGLKVVIGAVESSTRLNPVLRVYSFTSSP